MRINSIRSGAVIISASGMCDGERIKRHLRYNISRPECAVIFVGFQAVGTLGRRIVDGAKTIRLFREPYAVRARLTDFVAEGIPQGGPHPAPSIHGVHSHHDRVPIAVADAGDTRHVPVLLLMYARLASHEEREVQMQFGEAYTRYAQRTPRFIPRLGSLGRSHAGPGA